MKIWWSGIKWQMFRSIFHLAYSGLVSTQWKWNWHLIQHVQIAFRLRHQSSYPPFTQTIKPKSTANRSTWFDFLSFFLFFKAEHVIFSIRVSARSRYSMKTDWTLYAFQFSSVLITSSVDYRQSFISMLFSPIKNSKSPSVTLPRRHYNNSTW